MTILMAALRDTRVAYMWAVAFELAQRERRAVCLIAKRETYLRWLGERI